MESAVRCREALSPKGQNTPSQRRRILDTLIIALFGGIALLGAVLMLVLREPMRVALALITTMTSLGAIYGLLGVHFIAAFQVLIYVGAVMVFMVFVIMLLEVRESPSNKRYSNLLIPGGIAFFMLLGVLGISLWRGIAPSSTPPSVNADAFALQAFSTTFLRDYWLQFELTTVLLVAAIIAALGVIRTSRKAHG